MTTGFFRNCPISLPYSNWPTTPFQCRLTTEFAAFCGLTSRRLAYAARARERGVLSSLEGDPIEVLAEDDEASERLAAFSEGPQKASAGPRRRKPCNSLIGLWRPSAVDTASTLLLARALDARPDLIAALRTEGPVVIFEVPDQIAFPVVKRWLAALVWPEANRTLSVGQDSGREDPAGYAGAILVATEPPKRGKDDLTPATVRVLEMGLPIVVLSPPGGFVPEPLTRAVLGRITPSALDASVLALTIRIVTGRRCRPEDLGGIETSFDLVDLAIAVRHDRTPPACIAELRRLGAVRARNRASRDLTLDQIHGLDPAVSWARAAIADLAAWRRGEIGWDAVDHGIVLDGPPGTGKTLFARVFASEAALPLVSGSLAKWQANGHLGDLLKAMRTDFDLARAQAPAVMFIDEVDAFPNRSTLTHDHRDYQVEVVNGFIEQLDGIGGREGLIFVAASNDISRCDPAIVRSGRLNRVVRIDLPDVQARARMLRVRLGSDLPDIDLLKVARLTERMSGADIEKLVKDARRVARQAARPLTEADLLSAATADTDGRSPESLRRTAVHEAGHAVITVLLKGPAGVSVALQSRDGMRGWVQRKLDEFAGTRAEIENEIVILLAGRSAEQLILGDVSAGSGRLRGSDLAQATRFAAAMVCSLGQAGPHPLLFLAEFEDAPEFLSMASVRGAALEILEDAEVRTASLVRAHRAAIEQVAARLVSSRHIDGPAVAHTIEEAKPRKRRRGGPRPEPAPEPGVADGDEMSGARP